MLSGGFGVGIVCVSGVLSLAPTVNRQRCAFYQIFACYNLSGNLTCIVLIFFSHMQAVDITSCGNFVLIGWSSGHLDVYNLQSGIHRGHYGDPTGKIITPINQICISAPTNITDHVVDHVIM